MRQPLSALVYPVARDEAAWKYLLLRRVEIPHLGLPVFWQGITGGAEDDETVDEAAERELLEETGIGGRPVLRVGFFVKIPMKPEWREQHAAGTTHIVEHTFVCILPAAREPKLSGEHREFAWLAYREAYDRLLYQSNKDALQATDAWLAARE